MAYIEEKGGQFKQDDLVACFKTHLRTLKNQHERITAGPTKSQADIEHSSTSARRTRRQGVRRLQIDMTCVLIDDLDRSPERRNP
jgi:hypothetical protein